MSSKNECNCAAEFSVRLVRSDEYAIFKKTLDVGRHPAFIGRQSFERYATNGGALLYYHREKIVAASLINPRMSVLIALNVHPEHRSHGLGSAIIRFLMPNFARVLESRISFFEKLGYVKIGSLKKGISLNTQIMANEKLFHLSGRLKNLWNA